MPGTNKGTVSGNKYHSSMVGNYAFNIGSGTGDIDGATLNNKALMLYTERDNSALLAAYAATYNSSSSTAHGGSSPTVSSLNVTLKGYTLHKDGSWNAIALPFDFTAYSGSPLSGATIKQLDTESTAYDSESGVLQVAFKTVTVNTSTGMDRTKPYIVKWDSGTDVTDPTFTNVDGRRLSNSTGSTTDAPLIIRGSSKPFTLTDGMLLDAHNADNLGCHAAIVLSAPEASDGQTFGGWFADEQRTVAPTFIPFGSDGSFSLYAKLTKNELALADDSSNDKAIAAAAASGKVYEVTLSGRTLYRDGSWNTLCLPFDVSTASGTLSGDGVQAMTLDTSSSNLTGSTLTLNVTAATTIPAGTPFIIKWDNTGVNIENPIFVGVTIDATNRDATVEGVLTFTGTYAPVSIGSEGDKTKLYLGNGNTLHYPNGEMTIGTHRAYFQLADGITAGEPASPVRAFALNFGHESTGILSVSAESSREALSAAWYTLDGRRLDGVPTAKGLYIHGGKKVAIK